MAQAQARASPGDGARAESGFGTQMPLRVNRGETRGTWDSKGPDVHLSGISADYSHTGRTALPSPSDFARARAP